jgi:galactokinase
VTRRRLLPAFHALSPETPRLFRAPGRVNLIGEHTDYNEGFVLPVAIDQETRVAVAPRRDRKVRVHSVNEEQTLEFDLDTPGRPRRGIWLDYVEGVARALLQGGPLVGCDLAVESDIPAGAGLSSSAALEVATGFALLTLAGRPVDRVALALAGQRAEHAYVGTRCGIMDQLIVALGQRDHALFIDCRSLSCSAVPLRLGDAALVLFDSRVKHALASSAYNQRRAECEEGVVRLRAVLPGVRALRDVTPARLREQEALLPEAVRRRCWHVVGENARTETATLALRAGRLAEVGELMAASHRSLRDDYEVSCPDLDLLVELASATAGVLGSRMTGGGFGGCTVNLVRREAIDDVVAVVSAPFERRFGRRPGILVTGAAAGAGEIPVESA